MNLDDAIRDAIVEKFFEPTTLIVSHPIFDAQTGLQRMETVPNQTEAPALRVARAIWDAKQAEITKAVMDRLDIDELVEKVAGRVTTAVLAQLLAEPGNRWSANPTPTERERMLTKVYDDLAAEFGRQAVEHLRNSGGLLGILEAAEPAP